MATHRRNPSVVLGLTFVVIALAGLSGTAVAGTDPLRVTASGSVRAGDAAPVADNDGASDGVATHGVIFVDLAVPGTQYEAAQHAGTVTIALASLASGTGSPVYPVTVTMSEQGGPSLDLLAAPVVLTVYAPGTAPGAFPASIDVPVHITSDEARAAALATCVDGVPPPALEKSLRFTNPTSGRNRLGNGPNVHVRVTLTCSEDALVFCTVGHGCAGQPGGQVGGDIAFCNDPLAGWVTRNEAKVLPMTVGGSHLLHDVTTESGACASSTYAQPDHQGAGSGFDFQTVCDQTGLIAYLPAGSTAGAFAPSFGSNREVSSSADMMSSDRQGSGSKGSGGGVLTGQTFALKLAVALAASGDGPFVASDPGSCVADGGAPVCDIESVNAGAACDTAGLADDTKCFDRVDFVPAALGAFKLPVPESGPVEMCTQLSGQDRRLAESGACGPARCESNVCSADAVNAGALCSSDAECVAASDDVCKATTFPDCVAGASVQDVLRAAEDVLSGGTTALCGGDAATLNEALDAINQSFNGCGKVIDCALLPEGPGDGEVVSPMPWFSGPSSQLTLDTAVDRVRHTYVPRSR